MNHQCNETNIQQQQNNDNWITIVQKTTTKIKLLMD